MSFFSSWDGFLFSCSMCFSVYIWRLSALEQWLIGDATGLAILWHRRCIKVDSISMHCFKHQMGDCMNIFAPRAYLQAFVQTSHGHRLQVINVHTNAMGEGIHRWKQIEELLAVSCYDKLHETQYVTLITGDFNAGPETDEMSCVRMAGYYDCGANAGNTWDENINPICKGWLRSAPNRIDFVFVRKYGKTQSYWYGRVTCVLVFVQEPVSDHFGLFTIIRP